MKCLLKYQWVKLLRAPLATGQGGNGLLGQTGGTSGIS